LQKQTTSNDDEDDVEEGDIEEGTESEETNEDADVEEENSDGSETEVVEEEENAENEDEKQIRPSAATPAPLNSYVDEIILTDEDHLKDFIFTVNGKPFNEDTKISNGDPFELSIELNDLNFDELNFGP